MGILNLKTLTKITKVISSVNFELETNEVKGQY